MMSVSGFLALGVFVLVMICLGTGNEVMAAPAPDPCDIFLRRRSKTTTTEAPKLDDEKLIESKRVLNDFLYWIQATAPAPVSVDLPKQKAKSMDMNSFFAAYIEFLTKLFNNYVGFN